MNSIKIVVAAAVVAAVGFARADATAESWTAGSDVRIAAGETVVVEASTPQLNSLTVEGTLVCSNWLTCVQARSVVVADGGVITCAGPFWDREVQRASDSEIFPIAMSNRVWIAASESLTVAAGGRIDVKNCGYGCPFAINTYCFEQRKTGTCQDIVK